MSVELFILHDWNWVPSSDRSPSPHPQPPVATILLSGPMTLTALDSLYKGNYTVFAFLCLAYFT